MLEALKLNEATVLDKFLMMEELWVSMSHDAAANHFTPQWHLDTLVEKEERIRKNELSFLDISDAKERLKKSIEVSTN